jgi:predicted metal-dependent phosphoesterase TrpH
MSRSSEGSHKLRADLHVHYGDDLDSAHEIVKKAAIKGIGLVALLAKQRAPKELVDLPEVEGVIALPGMELVTAEPGRLGFIDLIAIGCDPYHSSLSDWVGGDNQQRITNLRTERAKGGITHLSSQYGFSVDVDTASEALQLRHKQLLEGSVQTVGLELGKLLFEVGNNTDAFAKLARVYPDDWEAALSKCCAEHSDSGYTMKDGFEEPTLYGDFIYKALFNRGRIFADRTHITPHEGITRIHAAGGVALYSPEGNYDPSLMQTLIASGIDGVMGFHATKLGMKSTPSENENPVDIPFTELKKLTKQDMILAGGSDFQGKDFQLGVGIGNMDYSLNNARLSQLALKLEEYGSPYAQAVLNQISTE